MEMITDRELDLLIKIENGESLSDDDYNTLIAHYEVERKECSDYSTISIVQLRREYSKARYFKIQWEEKLFEDEKIWSMPIEVYPKEVIKVCKVVEWFASNELDTM